MGDVKSKGRSLEEDLFETSGKTSGFFHQLPITPRQYFGKVRGLVRAVKLFDEIDRAVSQTHNDHCSIEFCCFVSG
jgi:hypothetical protein